jgi:hypothetical protein
MTVSAYIGLRDAATRDILSKTSPRSSVGRDEPQETAGKQRVSGGAGHVQDTAVSRLEMPDKIDPDLRAVFVAWDDLPPAIKAGIMAMVKAVQ